MINELVNYANSLSSSADVIQWLNTTGTKALRKELTTLSELEHIVDYFNSDAAPKRLLKMSIKDAKRKSDEWQKANRSKGRDLVDSQDDISVYYEFKDGSKIVKLLTKQAFQREGFLMSHCLGGYTPGGDMEIYSYRDVYNNPHATFEVRKNSDEIVQIKGKGNGNIHPKYIQPVLKFLELLGIRVRTSEMKNLGYYYIDETHLEYIKQSPELMKQVCLINRNHYAY